MKISRAVAAAHVAERCRSARPPLADQWQSAGGLERWLDRRGADLPFPAAGSAGVRALGFDEPEFPENLRRVVPSCAALFLRGLPEPLPPTERCVAIIGARRCTDEGRWLARDLAAAAARSGVVVVSGLALGTDAAAHEGALDAGGRTIAVLASPVDEPTPQRNRGLADRIVAGGGWLVSERPPGARLSAREFPIRNRLVAALVSLVVVVEASVRSGTLSTVGHALGLGVGVAAVPGWPTRPMSAGPNALLAAGAGVIASGDDLLAALFQSVGSPCAVDLDPDERAVLEGTPLAVAPIERWAANSGVPTPRAHVALTRLASKGVLRRLGGGQMARVL